MKTERHCERPKGARQSILWIASSLLLLAMTIMMSSAFAQDDAGLEQRLELARRIQELRPVREQVDSAIDRYLQNIPETQRESYGRALRGIMNYDALEKISVDAYAETYTEGELQAMYEYFQKPESLSAARKSSEYADKVLPEIVRMLDKAMMRVRTGG